MTISLPEKALKNHMPPENVPFLNGLPFFFMPLFHGCSSHEIHIFPKPKGQKAG